MLTIRTNVLVCLLPHRHTFPYDQHHIRATANNAGKIVHNVVEKTFHFLVTHRHHIIVIHNRYCTVIHRYFLHTCPTLLRFRWLYQNTTCRFHHSSLTLLFHLAARKKEKIYIISLSKHITLSLSPSFLPTYFLVRWCRYKKKGSGLV